MALLELVPGVYSVADLPVAYIRDLDAIVLADLHLGFEDEAASMGYFIPRVQGRRTVNILRRALEQTRASTVILAGDVKHSFSRLTRSEREELKKLFTFLLERDVHTIIVRGNHDNYLTLIARDYRVEVVDSLRAEGTIVVHGHKSLEKDLKGDIIVMGHEHPSIRIRDKLGYVAKFPCFLTAPLRSREGIVVVLPAVGQYQTGTTVSLSKETYLSPILKRDVVLEKAKPFILAENLGVLEFPELELLEELLPHA